MEEVTRQFIFREAEAAIGPVLELLKLTEPGNEEHHGLIAVQVVRLVPVVVDSLQDLTLFSHLLDVSVRLSKEQDDHVGRQTEGLEDATEFFGHLPECFDVSVVHLALRVQINVESLEWLASSLFLIRRVVLVQLIVAMTLPLV